MIRFENKKIIIATHVYATGPSHDVRDYLLERGVESLLFISHPLFFDQRLSASGFELYKGGKSIRAHQSRIKRIPTVLSYGKDVFLNIIWSVRGGRDWDLYIGTDNLNALAGIILKWFGRVRKVVYYVIDYNPKRFQNRVFNRIYHWIDQFCVRHADETWNLSPRMEEARKEYFGFSGGRQTVVPIGIWFDRFQRLDFSQINKQTLVFMGHILKKQGIQYVLEAIPLIIGAIPRFRFLVIGGGTYLKELKEQSAQLKIDDHVEFTGYIEDHKDVEAMLVRAGVAVAFYEKYDEHHNLSFTYFADPGKLKSYLAAGLPILTTNVSYNAREIEEKRCGRVVESSKESIAQAVIALMQDEHALQAYRENAIRYAQGFNWPNILDGVFKNSLS